MIVKIFDNRLSRVKFGLNQFMYFCLLFIYRVLNHQNFAYMEPLPLLNEAVLRITFPRKPVYKQANEYVASRIALERTQFRSYEWDKPRHDPFLHQLATERVFERVEKALAARREFAKGERVKLEEQWADLFNKEQEFQATFEKMNSFIISNAEKRQRALQRCMEDSILTKKREGEIEEIKAKISEVVKDTKEMEEKISEYRLYEKYLNETVAAATEFKNADDLLARYEALSSTRNELGKRQDATLRELENARLKTAKMAEEKGFVILGLNNTIADLRGRYSTANRNTLHWESVVCAIRDRMFQKNQELNEVKQSSWNIYNMMCKRKGETPKFEEEDFEKQLLYIKKTLQELTKISKIILANASGKLSVGKGRTNKKRSKTNM